MIIVFYWLIAGAISLYSLSTRGSSVDVYDAVFCFALGGVILPMKLYRKLKALL